MSAPIPLSGPTAGAVVRHHDSDLTIGDVIAAAADMAIEVFEGSVETAANIAGLDLVRARLEALHTQVLALGVPGSLAADIARLMERTATAKTQTQTLQMGLLTASEAISKAGLNAAARHKPLADAVVDAGHDRPAEREYHDA